MQGKLRKINLNKGENNTIWVSSQSLWEECKYG